MPQGRTLQLHREGLLRGNLSDKACGFVLWKKKKKKGKVCVRVHTPVNMCELLTVFTVLFTGVQAHLSLCGLMRVYFCCFLCKCIKN